LYAVNKSVLTTADDPRSIYLFTDCLLLLLIYSNCQAWDFALIESDLEDFDANQLAAPCILYSRKHFFGRKLYMYLVTEKMHRKCNSVTN